MKKGSRLLALACLLASALGAHGQDDSGKGVVVTGSIQSDILIPQDDEKIGTEKYGEWALTNTYADVGLMSKYVDAGVRLEYTQHPLPGFEPDFKGWGIANLYAKLHLKNWEVTAGSFYEQFGSGFILRTYEERSLGVDNSLLGARVTAKPIDGVTIKALTGWQRHYWTLNDAQVSGADIEVSLDQWIHALQQGGTFLTLGASVVNKHEGDEDIFVDATHRLNLPHYVNAFDVRTRLQHGGWNVLAEYAQKSQDPSFDNGYIYRNGYVAMLSTSYSKKGMSLLLQAKRSDNMAFRSARSTVGTSSFINHLPAFTTDHTYTLTSSYAYATQPDGEWAYQAELGYNFKRRTPLGGKYGTNVKVNFSHVRAIDKNIRTADSFEGYGSAFWKWGDETYYQDLNVQMEKKISNAFKLNLMYMNQFFNKTVVEGEGGMIHSDIFIFSSTGE